VSVPLPVRLGGLAANLARVKSFSDHVDHREVVASPLDESKYFIEWTTHEADPEAQAKLVELQIQLARWQLNWTETWNDPAQRATVAEQSRAWSEQVLAMSGLLNSR
jgi:hypothetical protein